jgi:hypothetical protein
MSTKRIAPKLVTLVAPGPLVASLSVDDIQLHVAEVKALARHLWGYVDPRETEQRIPPRAPGYDAWYRDWNDRSNLVAAEGGVDEEDEC